MLCLLQTCSCGDWLQWLSKIAQIRTVIIEPLQMNAAHSVYTIHSNWVHFCTPAFMHTTEREHCVLECMRECRIAPNYYFTVTSYQLAQQQVEHSSFCVSFALVLSCILGIWIDEILLTLHILFFSSLAVCGDNASVGKGNDACFLLLSWTLRMPSYLAFHIFFISWVWSRCSSLILGAVIRWWDVPFTRHISCCIMLLRNFCNCVCYFFFLFLYSCLLLSWRHLFIVYIFVIYFLLLIDNCLLLMIVAPSLM